jgi:hypothetical protein
MNTEEREEILNTFKWIKVKRWEHDPKLSTEDNYISLQKHHKEETEFLINKIREMV